MKYRVRIQVVTRPPLTPEQERGLIACVEEAVTGFAEPIKWAHAEIETAAASVPQT